MPVINNNIDSSHPLKVIWWILSGYILSRLLGFIPRGTHLFGYVVKLTNGQYSRFFAYWNNEQANGYNVNSDGSLTTQPMTVKREPRLSTLRDLLKNNNSEDKIK